jgi:hypothetical protein
MRKSTQKAFFSISKERSMYVHCSHSILLRKLHKLGIRGTALQWFTSYLQGRQQKIDINGNLSSSRPLDISVLQCSMF